MFGNSSRGTQTFLFGAILGFIFFKVGGFLFRVINRLLEWLVKWIKIVIMFVISWIMTQWASYSGNRQSPK